MYVLSRYWKICRISLAREQFGYEYRLVPLAQQFVQKFLESDAKEEFSNPPNPQNKYIQAALLSYFHANNSTADAASRAQAGLCLRCDVSYSILKACQKIDSLFGQEKSFTYQDLLPFVLNDDGQTLIILNSDGKTQLILDENGKPKTTAYKYFAVEVLRTFKPNSQSSMSLDNWTYLQTKQNQEIKSFLSDFGFKHLSDWALLNRTRSKQFERLSVRDRYLVEVFHAVYRRDRRKHRKVGAIKCPAPSTIQLQEMLKSLQERDVIINTTVDLIKELKQVATQLRQYDIWSYREPLEIYDPNTESYVPRPDLPNDSRRELDVEQLELLELLHQQLRLALVQGIEQEIRAHMTKLKKSKKYAERVEQFIPGLQLYYCLGISLKEIASCLKMTSWDQARRVLNPGELLNKVRALTVQQILDKVLEKARDMGLSKIPPELEYLKTLSEQIEAFVDEEVFQEAVEEIRAGKNRSMNSLYAQQLRLTLKNVYAYV